MSMEEYYEFVTSVEGRCVCVCVCAHACVCVHMRVCAHACVVHILCACDCVCSVCIPYSSPPPLGWPSIRPVNVGGSPTQICVQSGSLVMYKMRCFLLLRPPPRCLSVYSS